MTIDQAIARLDDVKFNSWPRELKISWLSELDSKIFLQIIKTHENGVEKFSGYTENTSGDTVLLVPEPFDSVYLRWMEAQVDYLNGEYEKYNSSITMFNVAFAQFENYYHANHMPLSKGRRFLF